MSVNVSLGRLRALLAKFAVVGGGAVVQVGDVARTWRPTARGDMRGCVRGLADGRSLEWIRAEQAARAVLAAATDKAGLTAAHIECSGARVQQQGHLFV